MIRNGAGGARFEKFDDEWVGSFSNSNDQIIIWTSARRWYAYRQRITEDGDEVRVAHSKRLQFPSFEVALKEWTRLPDIEG